jgi:hypothetical protein
MKRRHFITLLAHALRIFGAASWMAATMPTRLAEHCPAHGLVSARLALTLAWKNKNRARLA